MPGTQNTLLKRGLLASFYLVIVVYHAWAYIGHFGFDDMTYAELAYKFTQGHVDFNDHFTYRWPVILLTALSYQLLGVCDFASALPALLITFATLYLVYLLLRTHNLKTLFFGLSLTILNQWGIFYSDKLMSDGYITFSVLFCLYVTYRSRFSPGLRKAWYWAMLMAAGIFFGFIAKGTNVLLLPVLFYFFAWDLLRKRSIRFWLYTGFFFLALVSTYFFLLAKLTGNWLQLFRVLEENSYLNFCSYDQQPLSELLKRIAYAYFEMMIHQGMMPAILIVFQFFALKQNRKFWAKNDPSTYFAVSAFLLFLSGNFMSISLKHYIPLCIDPRHYLFVLPVAAIAAAPLLKDFTQQKKGKLFLIFLFSVTCIASFYAEGDSFWTLYFPLLVLFILYSLLPISTATRIAFPIAFAFILSVKPIQMGLYAQKINYKKQKETVVNQLLKKTTDAYVITNLVQKRLCNYYDQFRHSGQFLAFNEFDFDTLKSFHKKYLLLNWYTEYLSGIERKDMPLYAREVDPTNTLLYEDKNLHLAIYELHTIRTNIPLLASHNDFETPANYWEQFDGDIQKGTVRSTGNYSLVREYSATFSFPLDSIERDSVGDLLISTEVKCSVPQQSTARLIISVEEGSNAYLRQESEVQHVIESYDHWWTLHAELPVKAGSIRKNSRLKIYVWNPQQEKLFIDDFNVSISKSVRKSI